MAGFVYTVDQTNAKSVGRAGRQVHERQRAGRCARTAPADGTSARTAGFTLVELLIGLAIAALLVMLALPSYSVWIADAQIRNAAESIASGLRYAQGQAIARNAAIEFVIDTTAGTGGWTATQIDPRDGARNTS